MSLRIIVFFLIGLFIFHDARAFLSSLFKKQNSGAYVVVSVGGSVTVGQLHVPGHPLGQQNPQSIKHGIQLPFPPHSESFQHLVPTTQTGGGVGGSVDVGVGNPNLSQVHLFLYFSCGTL